MVFEILVNDESVIEENSYESALEDFHLLEAMIIERDFPLYNTRLNYLSDDSVEIFRRLKNALPSYEKKICHMFIRESL